LGADRHRKALNRNGLMYREPVNVRRLFTPISQIMILATASFATYVLIGGRAPPRVVLLTYPKLLFRTNAAPRSPSVYGQRHQSV